MATHPKKIRFPLLALVLTSVFLYIPFLYRQPDSSASSTSNTRDVSVFSENGSPKFCDARNSTDRSLCVFDIGLNTGQDTRLYLDSSPTTRVVAVEADPTLVARAQERFATEIDAGRLKVINIGLVGNATEAGQSRARLEFWVNIHNNKFSSFKQRTGCRAPAGEFLEEGNVEHCRRMEMETMSCSELVEEYGTPTYMKIDIEGMDILCMKALANLPEDARPRYVSKENAFEADVKRGVELGYKRFKVVNQAALQVGLKGDQEGHSGPWGEEATDIWIGRNWHSAEDLLSRLPVPSSVVIGGVERKGWYDLHASK